MQTVQFEQKTVTPSKIICVGRNYVAHIEELANEVPDEMVVFVKPNSAIAPHPSTDSTAPIHYEGEICFLCMDNELAGVGFGLDLTKRTVQDVLRKKGLPWERAKAFDGSAVFSDFVPFDSSSPRLGIELSINGNVVQQADSSMMIHSPEMIVRGISSFMTINDGDIIMSGTPAGVGELTAGDELLGRITQDDSLLVSQTWTAL